MVFLTIMVVGVIIVWFKPPQYTYTQIIELPSYTGKKATVRVWPYDLAVEKVKNFYLPLAESKYNDVHKDKPVYLSNFLTIKNAKNDKEGYLSLVLKGPINAGGAYEEILQTIVESLRADTSPILNKMISYLKTTVEKLQTQENLIISDIKLLSKKTDDTAAVLLGNEFIRGITQIDRQINDINYKLQSIHQTTASELVRSNLPVGPSKIILLVLIAFASLLVSFFTIFIYEFVIKNKK
jgi:hypothetical protein